MATYACGVISGIERTHQRVNGLGAALPQSRQGFVHRHRRELSARVVRRHGALYLKPCRKTFGAELATGTSPDRL